MTDSCATCMWARPAPARVDLDPLPTGVERRRCVRMPQAVENDATYWCGEYIKTREIASP